MFNKLRKRLSNLSRDSNSNRSSTGSSDIAFGPPASPARPTTPPSTNNHKETPSRNARQATKNNKTPSLPRLRATSVDTVSTTASSSLDANNTSNGSIDLKMIPNVPAGNVAHLKAFDTCIDAADALAACSGQSESSRSPTSSDVRRRGRRDPITNLPDCSVLVSADGTLLVIPQPEEDPLHQTEDTTEAYQSAVYLGTDLRAAGDKAVNGFSAKGWSIPATSTALLQTEESMTKLASFCEALILTQKECAARTSVVCDERVAESSSSSHQQQGSNNDQQRPAMTTQDWEIVDPRSTDFEMVPDRVGPVEYAAGTLRSCLDAFCEYHATTAENASRQFRMATVDSQGLLPNLRNATTVCTERALKRQEALEETSKHARMVEDRLLLLKQVSREKWNAVDDAEAALTIRLQEVLQERSRERELLRMERANQEVEAQDAAGAGLGATSEEIWNMVNKVAESMDDGSFEPLPEEAALKALGETKEQVASPASPTATPTVSREELEHEFGLEGLRAAALQADEAVEDASAALLNKLAALDTARRSARVAAETCLVSSGHAVTACIQEWIQLERASIQERLQALDALEESVNKVNIRADLDGYIGADKQLRGGSSHLGDDDDGGIASALAILNSHVEGQQPSATSISRKTNLERKNDDGDEDDHDSADRLVQAVEKLFQDDVADDLEEAVSLLCQTGQDVPARAKRSTICYALNSKRSSKAQLRSQVQFDGLCRVFAALLQGCDKAASANADQGGSVANAKMCMMLAQTFYITNSEDDQESGATGETEEDSCPKEARRRRIYAKSRLTDHPIWAKDDFWDEALSEQITESLTQCGVMSNFQRNGYSKVQQQQDPASEYKHVRKTKWHDLNYTERIEAASQVHAVVFAQLGALAHSMMEFGCGLERSCAFVRRMAIRNQLPSSQRTMLLQHLMEHHHVEGQESREQQQQDEGS